VQLKVHKKENQDNPDNQDNQENPDNPDNKKMLKKVQKEKSEREEIDKDNNDEVNIFITKLYHKTENFYINVMQYILNIILYLRLLYT
jgi:hypothetical protein